MLLLLLTRVCYQMLRCKQTLYLCIGCLWLLLTATTAAPAAAAAAAADTAYFTLSIADHPTCVKPGTPGVFLARVRGEKTARSLDHDRYLPRGPCPSWPCCWVEPARKGSLFRLLRACTGFRGRFPLRAASSTLFPLTSRVATRSNPKRPSNEHYRGTQSGSPGGPSVLLFTRMQPKTSTRTATGPKRHTTVPQLASQRFAFCV